VSRRKIIDHQITGTEKLAVTRTKDRSLSSLDSDTDHRLRENINNCVGEWVSVKDSDSVHYLLRRTSKVKKPIITDKERIEMFKQEETELKNLLTTASEKNNIELVIEIKKKLKVVKEKIQFVLRRMNDDRHV